MAPVTTSAQALAKTASTTRPLVRNAPLRIPVPAGTDVGALDTAYSAGAEHPDGDHSRVSGPLDGATAPLSPVAGTAHLVQEMVGQPERMLGSTAQPVRHGTGPAGQGTAARAAPAPAAQEAAGHEGAEAATAEQGAVRTTGTGTQDLDEGTQPALSMLSPSWLG